MTGLSRLATSAILTASACGLMLSPVPVLHAQIAAPPPAYSSSTKLNESINLLSAVNIESKSYAAYLSTVALYQRKQETIITQNYEACYAAATNGTQSKKCQTDEQAAATALTLQIHKLTSDSLVEHVSRMNQIQNYWAAKSGS